MAVENLHKNIPEASLHNPKGFSTASNDTYLTKDSTGGLEWVEKVNGSRTSVELNIGDWDMDATTFLSVAHSLSATEWKTVRNVEVLIRDDADTLLTPIVYTDATARESSGSCFVNSTNFELQRITGKHFDNTSYDSTSYNRGFISCEYTPD